MAPLVARYRYDRRGRLAAIDGFIDYIERDLSGHATLTRYTNGVEQHNDHNPLTGWLVTSRITRAGQILRQVTLAHDLVGNVTAQKSLDPTLEWTYGYDNLYRLVKAVGGGSLAPRQYTYDVIGNLLSTSELGAYTYGADGAASTCLTAAGGDTFTYDDRGHLVQGPWGTHEIDAQGRLRRINEVDGSVTEFTYDHENMLVRRRTTSATGNVHEVLSPDPLVLIENGELVAQVSDGDGIVARIRQDGKRNWLHADHLGSLVLVTNEDGDVARSIQYGPYGEIVEISGSEEVPQGFATSRASASDLVLLGARWYCPRIGRFISPDSVVANVLSPIAWNAYAYSNCNPTSYVDPTGNTAWKVFLGVLATLAIVVLIVVVSVATFGTGGPGAYVAGMAAAKLTWGTVFAATIVGIVAGGTIGALSVKTSKGGDWDDILLGALVGAAVGGITAFAGAMAGGALSVIGPKLVGKTLSGVVNGAIQNAGIGFASSYEGGMNNKPFEILGKMAAYAGIGALSGGFSKLVFTGASYRLPNFVSDAGPSTSGQVSYTITTKLMGKALDKLYLKSVDGKASGQGELSIDLGFRSLVKIVAKPF
jgi:RHS repeat-associated protein